MNKELSENTSGLLSEAVEAPGEVAAEAPRKGGGGVAWLALLLALAAFAGAVWLWLQSPVADDVAAERLAGNLQQLGQADARLSSEVSDLKDAVESLSAAGSDRMGDLSEGLASDRTRLGELQLALQEQVALTQSLQTALESNHRRLQAAEAALARVAARELDARGELDLAEVDYLLRLASERLVLFADAAAADRALALADAHLAAVDNPLYLGVRQAITTSRRELAAAERPDWVAIAGRLDSLQAAIPGLPFRGDDVAVMPDRAPVPEGWWAKFKATLASLVTVRRSDEAAGDRLSLADEDYLRQRLWLQLDLARLAAMRHDPGVFADALSRARATAQQWFDPESAAARAFLADLGDLAALRIEAAWPDISAPWQTLQLLRTAPVTPAASVESPGANEVVEEPGGDSAELPGNNAGDGE